MAAHLQLAWRLLPLVFVAACTTVIPVPSSGPGGDLFGIAVGDRVVITTKRRVEHVFDVASVTPESICGEDECVRVSDIEGIGRHEVDALPTAGMVLGQILTTVPAFGSAIGIPAFIAAHAYGCVPVVPTVRPEPHPADGPRTLAEARDERIVVALESVVVRNGPAAWANDAVWDEYRLRLRSLSGRDLRLVSVSLFDAFGVGVASSSNAGDLFEASRRVHERYRAQQGTPLLAVGYGCFGGPSGKQFALQMRLHPAELGHGTGRAVDEELKSRQTRLPVAIGSTDTAVNVFFPIVPRPSAIALVYADGAAEHRIALTGDALAFLHRLIDHRPEPTFPVEAIRRGFNKGYVKAELSIGQDGAVTDVKILAYSLPFLVEEARDTFLKYKYAPGPSPRTAEEVMHFVRRGNQ
jgi:hypothetical protein